MKLSSRILLSTFIAATYVGINIIVLIIGGDLAGGIHYEPHSLEELRNEIPGFLIFFIVTFVGTFIYNSLSKKKNLICPNCEHPFISYKTIEKSKCPKCSSASELADGFYKRHPELK